MTNSSKKNAVFVMGFNNWGKSTLIRELFNRHNFSHGATYPLHNVNFKTEFTVESHSNDDDWGNDWLDRLTERIGNSPDNGENLFSALCPTMHNDNSFVNLLTQRDYAERKKPHIVKPNPLYGYSNLYILMVEYKWEHHAKLILSNIEQAGSAIPNTHFIPINRDNGITNDAQRLVAKLSQIRDELNRIF